MTKIIHIRLELDCDNIATFQQSEEFIEKDIDTELNCCSNYYRKTGFYTYTDAEIQKMQDLEQAQFYKVYQLGYAEGKNDAQPVRKIGRWIRNDNGTYSCNLCQSWIPDEQHHYARFCLYCGATMKGNKNNGTD